MGLGPSSLDRTPDDIHELIAKDVADDGGDQEGQDDAAESDPEVVQVIEKRLFGFRIPMIPNLKEFLKNEHSFWPSVCCGKLGDLAERCQRLFGQVAGGGTSKTPYRLNHPFPQ